jgi:hypothetical protein
MDCLTPPADNTPDREQYDRFADFLRMKAGPANAAGRVPITDETYRYLLGEDVAPVAVDDNHPATHALRP